MGVVLDGIGLDPVMVRLLGQSGPRPDELMLAQESGAWQKVSHSAHRLRSSLVAECHWKAMQLGHAR